LGKFGVVDVLHQAKQLQESSATAVKKAERPQLHPFRHNPGRPACYWTVALHAYGVVVLAPPLSNASSNDL
jgi:hypothetical protein